MISTHTLRQQLSAFEFGPAFLDRGWNRPARPAFSREVKGRLVTFHPIAEQGGWMVYEVSAQTAESEPLITSSEARSFREAVDTAITAEQYHHILIFVNEPRSEAMWLFSRTLNKKRQYSHRLFNASRPIEPLVRVMRALDIPFELLNDDGEVPPIVIIDRLDDVFAEKVSKKFYNELGARRKGFDKFLAWITDEQHRAWYMTVLLNRLMFIYFIQHRGLMVGDTAYLRHQLEESRQRGKDQFYREFFLPLCFFGIGKTADQRGRFLPLFHGIPYLNGGLFAQHHVERDIGISPDAVMAGTLPASINISDDEFARWFDFFDSYRWTLDEEHIENERQINPDILGYIFEKYINQKQMGAYYTKEDITGYICRNTIIPRLFDMLAVTGKKGQQAVSPLPIGPHPNILNNGKGISQGNGIERYIYPAVKTPESLPTETEREYAARQARFEQIVQNFDDGKIATINDFITYNLDIERMAADFIATVQDAEVLRHFYFDALQQISVLDPTCGSGAFLFAALKLLFPLYVVCLRKMKDLCDRTAPAPVATWKGEFAFANEVDQQLTLADVPAETQEAILADFRREMARIDEHPNPEYFIYKSIIVNNLYGVDIMEEAVEICKLRLFLKLIAHAEVLKNKSNLGIEPLPDIDFNILCGNTLVGFATRAEVDAHFSNSLGLVFAEQAILDHLIPKLEAFAKATLSGRVDDTLKEEIEENKFAVASSLNREEMSRRGISAKRYDKFIASHRPFHWLVEFPAVMANGGFEVVIGNPPYVEYSSIRSKYEIQAQSYETSSTGNLYAFVWERGKNLTISTGRIGLIVPISSVSTPRMVSLVNTIKRSSERVWVSNYAVRPSQLFDGVCMNLSILLSINNNDKISHIFTTMYQRWTPLYRQYLFSCISYTEIPLQGCLFEFAIPKLRDDIENRIYNKIATHQRLSTLVSPDKTPTYQQLSYRTAGGRYYKIFLDRLLDTESKSNKSTYLAEYADTRAIVSVLSSNLWWWYYTLHFDMYNCKDYMIFGFPFSYPKDNVIIERLSELGNMLIIDMINNAERKYQEYATTGAREQLIFVPSKSKHIIDKIDIVLGEYYHLSDDENDFIINYDIKYRQTRDINDDGDDGDES